MIPVGPFESGLVTSYSPWMIPMDGFQELLNGHIHNGRLEKRDGLWLLGYGAHHPTTFAATGDEIASFSAANPTVVTTNAAHNFSSSDQVVIVGGDETIVQNNRYTVTSTGATTFTIPVDGSTLSYTSGAKVFLSPNNAVMGITTYLDSTNLEVMMGWDTRRAYIWDYTLDGFVPLDDHATSPTNYYSSGTQDYIRYVQWDTATAGNIMYFTNGIIQASSSDGLFTYNPAASPPIARINPVINSSDEVYGCKGVEVFKNRLLLFSPYEGASEGAATEFNQRVRWCRINDPRLTGGDGFQWRDNVRGNGGFTDAATQDNYIGHQKLLNEIIVFFTNSVWSLRYQPDPIEPFRWQKLNNNLSTRAPFANVGYDRYAISLGNRGIFATDGNESKRIDDSIDNFIENEIYRSQFPLVYAHRDYQNERALFLYPFATSTTNNRALVRDDKTGAFSEYEMDLSVIGDGANPTGSDLTMDQFPDSEDDNPLKLPIYGEDAGDLRWSDYFFDISEEAMSGGGYANEVYLLNFGSDDDGTNINMRLTTGEMNPFRDQGIEASLEYIDLFVDAVSETQMDIAFFKDSSDVYHTRKLINFLPNLNEVASITNIEFLSPSSSGIKVTASNHGLQDGEVVYFYNVKGMLEVNGTAWTVSNALDDSFEVATDASSFTTYVSNGLITRNPFREQLVFKRIMVGAVGNSHRIEMFVSGNNDPFILHRINYKFTPVEGRLL